MEQTHGPSHRAPSMVPSLPEDVLSLDTPSESSSPMSATLSYGSQARSFSNHVGLGISDCSLEPAYSNLGGFSPHMPFSMAQPMRTQIVPSNEVYSIPVKIDDFSNGNYYGLYTPAMENAHSPMSYYGSHTMSASPSYNPPMEATTLQAPFTTQATGYWAPMASCGPTTPPDMGSNMANVAGDPWDQHSYPTCDIVNASTLPILSGIPVTSNTYISTGPMGKSPAEKVPSFSTETTATAPKAQEKGVDESKPKKKITKGSKPSRKPVASASRRKSRPDQRYACRVCDFQFTRRSNRSEHEKRHDPNFKKTFPCGQCPKTFGRNADLNRHIDTVRRATCCFGIGC